MRRIPESVVESPAKGGKLSSKMLPPAQRPISWSKHGFVAYAADLASHNLCLTYLETAGPETSGPRPWQLAEPQRYLLRTGKETAPRIDRLAWSLGGTDLAAVDAHGNMTMVIAGAERPASAGNTAGTESASPGYTSSSYNKLTVIYQDTPDGPAPAVDLLGPTPDVDHQGPPSAVDHRRPSVTAAPPPPQITLDDAATRLVAFKWLHLDKPIIACHPAVRMEVDSAAAPGSLASAAALLNTRVRTAQARDAALAVESETRPPLYSYSYGVQQYKAHGPMHPVPNKQACLGLRRNGEIVLWYQGEHGLEYLRVVCSIDRDVWWTHAAIGFQRDGLVVVATYVDREVSLYTVSIDWGYLVASAAHQLKTPAHVTPEDHRRPAVALGSVRLLRERLVAPGTLTHLELVSPSHNVKTELDLLMVFSGGEGVMHRYQLQEGVLHPAFQGGASSVPATTPQGTTPILVLKEIIPIAAPVMAITACANDTYVAVTYVTGRVDLLNRRTQTLIHLSDAPQRMLPSTIFSVFDVGFRLAPPAELPLGMALSPNLCGYAALTAAGLTYRCAERAPHCLGDMDDDEGMMTFLSESMLSTVVALAYRYLAACFALLYSDDMLAVIQHEVVSLAAALATVAVPEPAKVALVDDFILLLLTEAHRAINFLLDYNRDQIERLLTSPPLQKLLSLQLAVRNPLRASAAGAQVASVVLTLRMVSFGLMLTLKSVYQQYHKASKRAPEKLDARFRAEHFASVLGIVRWAMDLIVMLNQDLFELLVNPGGESVALPLLLGKIPRALLLYAIVGIKRLNETLKKLSGESEASARLHEVIVGSPVPLDRFELFLTAVDKHVRSWESSMKANPEFSVLALELALVLQGSVPEQMLELHTSLSTSDRSIVGTLMDNFQIQLKPKVNLVNLFFHDVRLLGLTHTDPTYDSLRKTKMTGGALRKCVRCGTTSAVKDVYLDPEVTSLNFWTIAHLRNCVCGSSWVNV